MTTETKTVSTPLTADELKAIKQATSVVFFHDNGAGLMRLRKRTNDKEYGGEYEVTLDIPIFTGMRGKGTHDMTYAVESVTTAQYAEIWQSIVSLLRKGDKVSVEFQGDYYRPFENYEDIHVDTLVFKINRSDKGRTLQFLLDVSVSRHGNMSRMFRQFKGPHMGP